MSDREIMNAKSVRYRKLREAAEEYHATTIKFRDPIVKRVCEKFVDRSNEGYRKYGRTLQEEMTGGHKHLDGYLNDIQEELMDAILYIQTARELIDTIVGPEDDA